MTLLQTLTSKSRFHDMQFVQLAHADQANRLLVGCEDGKTRIYRLPIAGEWSDEAPFTAKLESELIGHANR